MMKEAEKKLRDQLGLVAGEGRKNYSVKAGAGGGKTTMLSQRICRQILEGTPIEEFVIITYTNAAAAELREKITDRLHELLDKTEGEEQERAETALHSIELMEISTIHSFLLKILKEHAFESGVVMDVRMLEADEDEARIERFFNNWYKERYEDFYAFKDDWTYIAQVTRNKTFHAREVIRNMFHDLANIRDEEIIYDLTDHTSDLKVEAEDYVKCWKPVLNRFLEAYNRYYPLTDNGERCKEIKVATEIREWIEQLNFDEDMSSMTAASLVEDSLEAIYKKRKKEEKGFYSDRSKAGKENNPLLNAVADQIIAGFPIHEYEWKFTKRTEIVNYALKASKVVEYVMQIQRAYQEQINSETLEISNDDILYRAKKLLTDPEHQDLLDSLRRKYSKIYVDEFQDTTGLQAGLIRILAEKEGTKPEENEFTPDKLLFVGDPKQSIYRFTGAEIAVYQEMDRLLDGKDDSEAESVTLESNFRSNEKIVEWVNGCFDKLMAGNYSSMFTDWKPSDPKALNGVFGYRPDIDYDDVEAVVDLVDKLVKDNYYLEEPIRDKEKGISGYKKRSIRYSDIMILCRNTTHMDPYVRRFAEEEIPVSVQGKISVEDDEVLRNFVLLAEYFAGFKNKKRRDAAAQILQGSDLTGVDPKVLQKAEDRLWEIKREFSKRKLDSAAKLRFLLAEEEFFLPKEKNLPKERVREYRTRLNQMVETCIQNNTGDYKELVRGLREYLSTKVEREVSLVSEENAVRFMNVHKAKGLTGQIVIIADRSANEKCRYSGFKTGGKYYPSARYKYTEMASDNYFPSYGYSKKLMQQAYDEETDEAIRLQYVAATRAAHALIIMPNNSKDPWFSAPEYDYENLKPIQEWLEENADASLNAGDSAALADSKERSVLTLEDLTRNRDGAFETEAGNYGVLELRQQTSITPSGIEMKGSTGFSSGEDGYSKEVRPTGNIFGLILHRTYELIFTAFPVWKNESAEAREKRVTGIINQSIMEHMDDLKNDEKAANEIFEYLRMVMSKYFDTVIVPIAESADEIYPEYCFSFYVPDEKRGWFTSEFAPYLMEREIQINEEPIWINGQADLVVKQKDGSFMVYDYKSDAMNGKTFDQFKQSLDRKYEGQLKLYIYAVSRNFEVDPSQIGTKLIHMYMERESGE